MKIVFNGMFGGTTKIDNVFRPLVIKLRQTFKANFENVFFGKDVEVLKFYVLVNGEISSYYNDTGVFKMMYLKKRKEIIMELCYANTLNDIDSKDAFTVLSNLILESCSQISAKTKKLKLEFGIEEFEKILRDIIDELKEKII